MNNVSRPGHQAYDTFELVFFSILLNVVLLSSFKTTIKQTGQEQKNFVPLFEV